MNMPAMCYFFFKSLQETSNEALTIYTRRVMGLKKRRLSRSGAANHVIIATKN
jgi:hypothetical protein